MLIKNLIDFLLPFDSIQSIKKVGDYGDEVFAVAAFNLYIALRDCCIKKLFDILWVQIKALIYLLPIIQYFINIVVVLRH